jgi:hypothetical protein
MNRSLPLIGGLLGILFLAIAAYYWFVPGGPDPTSGVPLFHVKRAIILLIIALVLFAFAWFQSRRSARI